MVTRGGAGRNKSRQHHCALDRNICDCGISVPGSQAWSGLADADCSARRPRTQQSSKILFARPRPDVVSHVTRVFTTSFPSGHATLSAITYLTIAALLARAYPSPVLDLYFISLAAPLTVLIGLSRIYLGVHFPTDILGGWCIGAAWAIGCWALMAWLQQGGQVEPPGPV